MNNELASVKAWMTRNGYSSGGGDNVGYVLANLRDQILSEACSIPVAAALQAENTKLTADVYQLRSALSRWQTGAAQDAKIAALQAENPWLRADTGAAAALLREAGWTVEGPKVKCQVCNGRGHDGVLHFWERPGGPPGNGYSPCPTCSGTGARS